MGETAHRIGRVVAWVAAGVALAGALVLTAPDRLGLSTTTPVAQVIAFRGTVGVALLALGGVLLLGAVVSRWWWERRAVRRGRPRPVRRRALGRPAVVVGAAFVLFGAINLGVLASRGVVDAPPRAEDDRGSGAVTVLALNTFGAGAPDAAVATAVLETGADVVALPETPPAAAEAVADRLALAGVPVQVFTNDRGYSVAFTTSLLVSDALGRYVQTPTREGVGYVRVDPVGHDGPPIIAVHPSAPLPGRTHWWTRELTYAVELCRETPGVVMAGDLNATLDHAPMRDLEPCVDATSSAGWQGSGALGTWPNWLPWLLGAPIDRVLVDGRTWQVDGTGTVEVGDSDHRGVVARVIPIG